MAKKPTSRTPVEAAKPPPVATAPADAAAAATQPGAETEGVLVAAPSGSGASTEASSSTTGPAAPASVLGGAGEDSLGAAAAAAALFGGRASADLDDALDHLKLCADAFVLAVGDLTDLAVAASPEDAAQALTRMTSLGESLAVDFNLAAMRLAERKELATGDLVELEVRSRDGKPFRRAGFLFGDAYQTVHATPAQAEAIRADRGCQVKA